MRLAQNLSPMTPAQARLPMKPEAAHRELSCVSCHGAHEFNTRSAAVDACLSCHNDDHSRSYQRSKHFALWFNETTGEAPADSGVSCATCHLPREKSERGGQATVRVQHNQNANLRPNEKMIRSVCLDCHGLEFSLDALADAALIRTSFIGRPARHVESLDLAVQRQMELQKK
jgi:formate-dependent nitrite reductase cytochrome c552 subunit